MYPTHILDEDRDVYYDSHDLSVIAEPLRSRIYTMMRDCPSSTYVVSGRRSPWQQYLLRVGRVGADHAFNSNFKGDPTTALPYRSHHQDGTAIDMGGPGLNWMIAHRHDYGLELTVPGENWHFEVEAPSQVRIINYPGGPATPPTLPPEDIMDEGTLFQLIGGAVRPAVRLVKIKGDGLDEAWATDFLTTARRAGPVYAQLLTDHMNVGNVIELPLEDAAVIGNIYRTFLISQGRGDEVSPTSKYKASDPRTWPR